MNAQRASALLGQVLERVCQDQERFARTVYELFFASAPDAKALFKHVDWNQQQKMLIGALVLMIKNLNNPALFQVTMRNLGERHVRYGAKVEHFVPFSQAILGSMREQLGSDWNEEIEEAWSFAFGKIEQTMIEAGVKPRTPDLQALA